MFNCEYWGKISGQKNKIVNNVFYTNEISSWNWFVTNPLDIYLIFYDVTIVFILVVLKALYYLVF